MTIPTPKQCRSADEFSDRLERMTPGELQALKKIARAYVGEQEAEDLRQEATVRVLGGERPWPADVDLVPFLAGVMRSLATDDRRKQTRRQHLHVVPKHGDQLELENIASGQPSQYDLAVALSELGAIKQLFDHDSVGWTFIEAKVEDCDRKDVIEFCETDEKGYETISRRVRRTLEKGYRKDGRNV
ncbi:hypothetical protein G6L37_17730 [Agrobacterium rubi]|nr:hypothetical protein [Agrobacterium rubi]NTF27209.1 hypothetical protein [Agrobacterium rubi]